MSNSDLTLTAVSAFKSSIPDIKWMDLGSLSYSLSALRFSRDKTIAHNEAIDSSGHLRPTWGDARPLTEYAKRLVHVIAYAYLNISFGGNEGNYFLTHDASRTAFGLRRLLRTANVIEPDESH